MTSRIRSWLIITAAIVAFISAVYLAENLSEDYLTQAIVQEAGYWSVYFLALISGLNPFLPVPPATFSPIFVASNLTVSAIIITLTLGTITADLIGFFIGKYSKDYIRNKYPKTFLFFENASNKNSYFIIFIVALYASFIPFPNEVIIVPLSIGGFPLKKVIVALIAGNLIHHTILVHGALELNQLVF